jgi:hypothetical protein
MGETNPETFGFRVPDGPINWGSNADPEGFLPATLLTLA